MDWLSSTSSLGVAGHAGYDSCNAGGPRKTDTVQTPANGCSFPQKHVQRGGIFQGPKTGESVRGTSQEDTQEGRPVERERSISIVRPLLCAAGISLQSEAESRKGQIKAKP